MEEFDLIVLGGGNAIGVARDVAAAGRRVALIEKGPLGGTCPNRGCIPSKLLLGHADVAQAIWTADRFHVQVQIRDIDRDAILRDTAEYVEQFDGSLADGLPDGVALHRAHGRFVDNATIDADGARLTAPRIVLATGARPRVPRIPGLDGTPYWTSDDVFRLRNAPRSIAVLGGGFVGCELAYFFHAIGVNTLLVQHRDRLLGPEDEEIRDVFQRGFPAPVRLGTELAGVAHDGQGFRLELKDSAGDVTTHECEALLLAVGRVPNTADIGLENTDVTIDEDGFVQCDECLRTGADGIFALGDVTGDPMFTHAATDQAAYLTRRFTEDVDEPYDPGPIPHAVFAHPEIGAIGATEQELRAAGADYVAASVPYTAATKGRALKEEHGLCKLLLDRDGKILGCHIVGQHASVLLHEVIPVMKWRNHISSLTGIIHVHPSLPEVVRGAARKAEKLLEGD
jgi:dihydrolipoamide dehydrogenase